MTRNRNTSRLALLAVLVIGVTATSAAHAEEPAQLAAESSPTTLDGSQPAKQVQVFTRLGKQVFCEVATFHVESEHTAETLTMTPTYEKCTMVGVGPATVKMNGCNYLLHLTEDSAGEEPTYTAITDLTCPGGKQVEILVYVSEANHTAGTTVCEFTLGAQSSLKTIELTNEAASAETTPKDWIKAHLKVEKITSKSLKNFLLCGEENNATATLEGELELKGTDSEGDPTGVTVTEPTKEHPEPAQITSETGTVVLDGDHGGAATVLKRSGKTVTCKVANYSATAGIGDTELTVTPEFTGCESSTKEPATVTLNGCHYVLHLGAEPKEIEDTWRASTDIICPEGEKLQVNTYETHLKHTEAVTRCSYDIAEQKGIEAIDLTNKPPSEATPKDWLLAHFNLGGITSVRTKGGLPCGLLTDKEGTYGGEAGFLGTNLIGETIGVTVSTDE